jgi:hypothetical protein
MSGRRGLQLQLLEERADLLDQLLSLGPCEWRHHDGAVGLHAEEAGHLEEDAAEAVLTVGIELHRGDATTRRAA